MQDRPVAIMAYTFSLIAYGREERGNEAMAPYSKSRVMRRGIRLTVLSHIWCSAQRWAVLGSILALALPIGVASGQGTPCATAPFGMVAWYPLNEQSGATAIADIHTSVNPLGPPHGGTPQPGPVGPVNPSNGPAPVMGKVGPGALYFYGGRLVTVPLDPQLDFGTGDFSIDAWIRPVDVGQTVGGFMQPIVDKFDPVPPAGFALYLRGDTVGGPPHPSRLKLTINGMTISSLGTIPFANPLPPSPSGPWTHVAATVRRSGPVQGKLYINGMLDSTFMPPTGSVDNGLFMWIGETRVPGPRGEIAIDELEIFNRELTPTEIFTIASAGSAGKCRNTVSALVSVNQPTFTVGQTLAPTVGLANPGLLVMADFYLVRLSLWVDPI